MTETNFFQIMLYLLTLLVLVIPLGWYIAKVYETEPNTLHSFFATIERPFYRLCGIKAQQDMDWKDYLFAMLWLNLMGIIVAYIIQRLQFYLPLNPQNFSAPSALIAFNTAVSFVTNTDWQAYSGETTMSYFTQMTAFTVQNFISAATGMSLLMALIRGLARHETKGLGNFWVDTFRGVFFILLPLSFLLSLMLVSQGVIQNFKSYEIVNLIQPFSYQNQSNTSNETITIKEQLLPMGPAASQIAIKQLGTNGGGFFNTNSAHPFENPTPLSNFLEMIAILLIPAALCLTFGILIKDKRQGWALLAAMFIIFIPCVTATLLAEQHGNPTLKHLGVDTLAHQKTYPAGNMEGKETRFGILNSALWATATTASSNGSTNAMLDSFTPLGGLVPLWMMQLGEIVFGGVGSGLHGMIMLVIITVFITGLMVGRTPEYLGKKIEPFEMKMASVAILIMPLIVLSVTALACVIPEGIQAIANPGAHGFTEILYAFTSMGNNNGSAFAGLQADTPFYTLLGGLTMLISRYWIAIPTLAIAGSLVKKKIIPTSSGTLKTHTPLFIILLVCVTIVTGALAFLPSLSLGPIVEHLLLWRGYAH